MTGVANFEDVVSEGSNWRLRIALNTYQLKQFDEASRNLSKNNLSLSTSLCLYLEIKIMTIFEVK